MHIIGKVTFGGALLLLGACGAGGFQAEEKVAVSVATEESPRAKPRPETGEGAVATAGATDPKPSARPEQDLGVTIVSLGLLERDGLWLKTPLVKSEAPGRVVFQKTGSTANVTLLPLDTDPGSGSQLSLSAMQVMGIPLTDLAKVRVFVR